MLERRPLRNDVSAEILGRIVDGRLPSGTRINECHLSTELGISRTPLREALFCLATVGALKAEPGRGFSVPHFTLREVTELLAVLAVVLPTAIRQGGPGELKDQLEARNALGRARLHTEQPARFCEHLAAVLHALLRPCTNRLLSDDCHRLIRLLLRYLHEALGRGWDPGSTLEGLQDTLQAIQRDDRDDAGGRLERLCLRLGEDLAARFPAALEAHG